MSSGDNRAGVVFDHASDDAGFNDLRVQRRGGDDNEQRHQQER